MLASGSEIDRSTTGYRFRSALFWVTVTAAFALGLYSLLLASVNAGKVPPGTNEGWLRTATASDTEKIRAALGDLAARDLVYVILETPLAGPDPAVENAARRAARTLSDSGLAVSVRVMEPNDPDFRTIATQNGISRFPAILMVKKDGGIVLVTNDLNEQNLLHAYHRIWGRTSSCEEEKSAIY